MARAVKVRDIVEALESLYPVAAAADWDKNGLLVGDAEAEVSGVVLALDPSLEALRFAKEKGANVVLTHHPLFLADLPSLNREDSLDAQIAFDAIREGIALVNCHTNLDVSERAKRLLGEKIKLNFFGDLPPLEEGEPAYAALWRCPQEVSLKTFSKLVTEAFEVDIRVFGSPEKKIEKVATATGSARRQIAAAEAAGCDLLIGGEISYHDALDAEMRGLATISLGHDVSEWPLVDLLYEAVKLKTFVEPERIYRMETYYPWTSYRSEI